MLISFMIIKKCIVFMVSDFCDTLVNLKNLLSFFIF